MKGWVSNTAILVTSFFQIALQEARYRVGSKIAIAFFYAFHRFSIFTIDVSANAVDLLFWRRLTLIDFMVQLHLL